MFFFFIFSSKLSKLIPLLLDTRLYKCQMGWNSSELMIIVISSCVLYSTFNLEDFAIVWLHARSCVTTLYYTPAYGLYSRASNTSTPSI
jgi:hypothetical protein